MSRWRALAWCVAALGAAACSEPAALPQLTVSIGSDGLALSRIQVQLLAPDGQAEAAGQWFELPPGCAEQASSGAPLGSFGVLKTRDPVARLLVSGYATRSDDSLELVVQRRLDARFEGGRGHVSVLLGAACAHQLACDSEHSCDPESGECAPIPSLRASSAAPAEILHCLSSAAAPDESELSEPDAGAPPLDAASDAEPSDAEPSDARASDDADAAQLMTAAEAGGGEPDADAGCIDGDYARSDDPLHCGACETVCSSANIEPACALGRCDGQCLHGFADCNQDKRTDGCETDLSTRDHCGDCRQVCPYGVCTDQKCEGELTRGFFNMEATETFSELGLLAVRVPLRPGKLVALGLLTQLASSVATTYVRLGLYYDGPGGIPVERLAFTDQLPVVDSSATGGANSGPRGTEGPPIAPFEITQAGNYWIAILPSGPLSVYIQPDTTIFHWQASDVTYGQLPGMFPIHNESVLLPYIDVYAVLDPTN